MIPGFSPQLAEHLNRLEAERLNRSRDEKHTVAELLDELIGVLAGGLFGIRKSS